MKLIDEKYMIGLEPYLNNHFENAWRKIGPKKFEKLKKKSC